MASCTYFSAAESAIQFLRANPENDRISVTVAEVFQSFLQKHPHARLCGLLRGQGLKFNDERLAQHLMHTVPELDLLLLEEGSEILQPPSTPTPGPSQVGQEQHPTTLPADRRVQQQTRPGARAPKRRKKREPPFVLDKQPDSGAKQVLSAIHLPENLRTATCKTFNDLCGSPLERVNEELMRENNFHYDPQHGIMIGIPQQQNKVYIKYPRASKDILRKYLIHKKVWLMDRSRPSKVQPARAKDTYSYSFWLAQAFHYGLGFQHTVDDVKGALQKALTEGTLKVPQHLRELRHKLKGDFRGPHYFLESSSDEEASVKEESEEEKPKRRRKSKRGVINLNPSNDSDASGNQHAGHIQEMVEEPADVYDLQSSEAEEGDENDEESDEESDEGDEDYKPKKDDASNTDDSDEVEVEEDAEDEKSEAEVSHEARSPGTDSESRAGSAAGSISADDPWASDDFLYDELYDDGLAIEEPRAPDLIGQETQGKARVEVSATTPHNAVRDQNNSRNTFFSQLITPSWPRASYHSPLHGFGTRASSLQQSFVGDHNQSNVRCRKMDNNIGGHKSSHEKSPMGGVDHATSDDSWSPDDFDTPQTHASSSSPLASYQFGARQHCTSPTRQHCGNPTLPSMSNDTQALGGLNHAHHVSHVSGSQQQIDGHHSSVNGSSSSSESLLTGLEKTVNQEIEDNGEAEAQAQLQQDLAAAIRPAHQRAPAGGFLFNAPQVSSSTAKDDTSKIRNDDFFDPGASGLPRLATNSTSPLQTVSQNPVTEKTFSSLPHSLTSPALLTGFKLQAPLKEPNRAPFGWRPKPHPKLARNLAELESYLPPMLVGQNELAWYLETYGYNVEHALNAFVYDNQMLQLETGQAFFDSKNDGKTGFDEEVDEDFQRDLATAVALSLQKLGELDDIPDDPSRDVEQARASEDDAPTIPSTNHGAAPPAKPLKALGASSVAPNQGRRLWVANIPLAATKADVAAFFFAYRVSVIDLPVDPGTGRRRPHIYITFQSLDEAKRALTDLSGKEFMGHKISVQFSYHQPAGNLAVAPRMVPAHSREGNVNDQVAPNAAQTAPTISGSASLAPRQGLHVQTLDIFVSRPQKILHADLQSAPVDPSDDPSEPVGPAAKLATLASKAFSKPSPSYASRNTLRTSGSALPSSNLSMRSLTSDNNSKKCLGESLTSSGSVKSRGAPDYSERHRNRPIASVGRFQVSGLQQRLKTRNISPVDWSVIVKSKPPEVTAEDSLQAANSSRPSTTLKRKASADIASTTPEPGHPKDSELQSGHAATKYDSGDHGPKKQKLQRTIQDEALQRPFTGSTPIPTSGKGRLAYLKLDQRGLVTNEQQFDNSRVHRPFPADSARRERAEKLYDDWIIDGLNGKNHGKTPHPLIRGLVKPVTERQYSTEGVSTTKDTTVSSTTSFQSTMASAKARTSDGEAMRLHQLHEKRRLNSVPDTPWPPAAPPPPPFKTPFKLSAGSTALIALPSSRPSTPTPRHAELQDLELSDASPNRDVDVKARVESMKARSRSLRSPDQSSVGHTGSTKPNVSSHSIDRVRRLKSRISSEQTRAPERPDLLTTKKSQATERHQNAVKVDPLCDDFQEKTSAKAVESKQLQDASRQPPLEDAGKQSYDRAMARLREVSSNSSDSSSDDSTEDSESESDQDEVHLPPMKVPKEKPSNDLKAKATGPSKNLNSDKQHSRNGFGSATRKSAEGLSLSPNSSSAIPERCSQTWEPGAKLMVPPDSPSAIRRLAHQAAAVVHPQSREDQAPDPTLSGPSWDVEQDTLLSQLPDPARDPAATTAHGPHTEDARDDVSGSKKRKRTAGVSGRGEEDTKAASIKPNSVSMTQRKRTKTGRIVKDEQELDRRPEAAERSRVWTAAVKQELNKELKNLWGPKSRLHKKAKARTWGQNLQKHYETVHDLLNGLVTEEKTWRDGGMAPRPHIDAAKALLAKLEATPPDDDGDEGASPPADSVQPPSATLPDGPPEEYKREVRLNGYMLQLRDAALSVGRWDPEFEKRARKKLTKRLKKGEECRTFVQVWKDMTRWKAFNLPPAKESPRYAQWAARRSREKARLIYRAEQAAKQAGICGSEEEIDADFEGN